MQKQKLYDFLLNEDYFFVFTAIHNGHYMPENFVNKLGISEATQLQEEDPYTDFFTKPSPSTIVNNVSRFWFDVNRNKQKAVYLKPEDAWGLPVRKQELTEDEIKNAYKEYDNFYKQAESFFDKIVKKHKKIIVFDLHSYNHQRKGINTEFDDPEKNPEIILGTSNMEENYFDAVKKIQSKLLEYDFFGRKLDVRVNVKFPGGNFPRWFNAKYKQYGFCLAIEFKKIFMNEWTGELDKKVQFELKNALDTVIEILPNLI